MKATGTYQPFSEERLPSCDILQKLVDDAKHKRTDLMESFVVAYLQETGLKITEVELVEQWHGSALTWRLRPIGESSGP